MFEFPAIHDNLVNADMIRSADRDERPNAGIYRSTTTDMLYRILPVTRHPSITDEVSDYKKAVRLATEAGTEADRLRDLGMGVVRNTPVIVREKKLGVCILSMTEKITAVPRGKEYEAQRDEWMAGLIQYVADAFEVRGPVLRDIFHIRQTMYGHTASDTTDKIRLVDIDPLVDNPKRQPNPTTACIDNTGGYMKAIESMISMKFFGSIEPLRKIALRLHETPKTRKALLDYYYRRAYLSGRTDREFFMGFVNTILSARVNK